MPSQLEKEIRQNGGLKVMDGDKMGDVYTKAFTNTNKAMHKCSIDDTLSGTTGVTVFLRGDTLYVANVGDSRAIIGTDLSDGGTPGTALRFAALSNDQTPFRKDERERVKKLVSCHQSHHCLFSL